MKKLQGTIILVAIAGSIAVKILSGMFALLSDNVLPIVTIIVSIISTYLLYLLYTEIYFGSGKFKKLRGGISNHTNNCNELNHYIEELKRSYVNVETYNYGSGQMLDNSYYNYQRKEWSNDINNSQTYQCSATVCKNANNQPMKYLCKYFNIKKDEDTLSKFEKVLNDFTSVEQGKELIKNERESILKSISTKIPYLIRKFNSRRLIRKLGFETVDISKTYFPSFTFRYVSAGGNSSSQCIIRLDVENLNHLVNYLNNEIKWRKSIAGQRALMTSRLRNEIKERDYYKCCSCNNGTHNEPNLLLEIDHIIPLSKGGETTYGNLQTLCWKCNRTKGAKILVENEI